MDKPGCRIETIKSERENHENHRENHPGHRLSYHLLSSVRLHGHDGRIPGTDKMSSTPRQPGVGALKSRDDSLHSFHGLRPGPGTQEPKFSVGRGEFFRHTRKHRLTGNLPFTNIPKVIGVQSLATGFSVQLISRTEGK